MSDSVQPHRQQLTRLPRLWDSPGKNTGVGCHFLLQCMKVKSLSRVQLLVTPWTAAYQAPPSMRFSRQEYWSGVPLTSLALMLVFLNCRFLNQRLILECEVKWALGSITTNKASGGYGISAELVQILKDDAVKVLHSIWQQIWKTQKWPQDWKGSVFIPNPKKGNAKECSNCHKIALISHASETVYS